MQIDEGKSIDINAIEHDMVGTITTELVQVLANSPMIQPKDLYIADRLDQMFDDYDWSKSFERPQIIIYDDLLPSEILILLHKWLRKKCADIENIVLVTTHHTGIKSWWHEWCRVHHEKSFGIKERLFFDRPTKGPWVTNFKTDPASFDKPKKFYVTKKK